MIGVKWSYFIPKVAIKIIVQVLRFHEMCIVKYIDGYVKTN